MKDSIRLAKELIGCAKAILAFRDKFHNPDRREKDEIRRQMEEDIADFYNDYRENKNNQPANGYYQIRSVHGEDEAEIIQDQYEKAMSRGSTYLGNVYGWVQNGLTQVIESEDGDYVVGFRCGRAFILSHFAPKTLRSGSRFLEHLASGSIPVIMAVPQPKADMLARLGYREVGHIPQFFAGEIVDKTVMASNAADEDVIFDVFQKKAKMSWFIIELSNETIYNDIGELASDLAYNDECKEQYFEVIRNYNKYSGSISIDRMLDLLECVKHKKKLADEIIEAMDSSPVFSRSNRFKLLKSRISR